MIKVVTLISVPPSVVFDLELDAEVHAASLPGESFTTSTGRPLLGPGDEVTLQARHFGLAWALTSRITAYRRPVCFVDEQVRGPFRSLRHEHRFDEVEHGHTRMTDLFDARGPLGTHVVLAPYLRRLLVRRAAHIKRLAERG